MTNQDITREAALKMLRRGIATQSDVARLARVDRQLVRYWARQAGIDPTKIRRRLLATIWRRFIGG